MKIAAAIGMAIALIALVIVAMNMDSTPPIEPINPKDRIKPQVTGAGQAGGTVDRNFSTDVVHEKPFDSITKAPVVAAGEAIEGLDENSLVIGVIVEGESRAYPLSMLSGLSHAVVNDELGNQKIAVTWDDHCQSAAIFSRTSKNIELILQSSGRQWQSSLLLKDESDSLWSQLTTECKRGALSGNKLTMLPATVVMWSAWKSLNPNTTVMNLPKAEDAKASVDATSFENANASLVGIVGYRGQKGYRRNLLYQHRVINDEIDSMKFVLVANPKTHAIRAFVAEADTQPLTFQWDDEKLTDKETGSQWDPATGVCTSGNLEGMQLEAYPTITCLANKWREINRDSAMWSARELNGKN